MTDQITVTVSTRYGVFTQKLPVAEPLIYESFAPIRESSEPLGLLLEPGSVLSCSEEMRKKLTVRKNIAEYLATTVTDALLKMMSESDTLNGEHQ